MEARDRGLPAYAETCPQYLFCTEDDLRGDPGDEWKGAGYVCTPPLRPKHHHDHLWRGLRNYDLQVVATDHCPFCMKDQKELGRDDFSKIPNGMPGVETRLHLLWEGVTQGKISMNRFVEITSTAPAKIFGMYGKKGTLAVGADADVVVWDPKQRASARQEDAPHARRLLAVRGPQGRRAARRTCCRAASSIVENDQWVGKAASRAAASSCAAGHSVYEREVRPTRRGSTRTGCLSRATASSRRTRACSWAPRARTTPTPTARRCSTASRACGARGLGHGRREIVEAMQKQRRDARLRARVPVRPPALVRAREQDQGAHARGSRPRVLLLSNT